MNFLSRSDATGSQGHWCTADGCCSLSCCKRDCTCLDPCDLMRQTAAQRHHGALGGAKRFDCAALSAHGPTQMMPSHTLPLRKKEIQGWGLSEVWEWRHDIHFHHLSGDQRELDTICPDKTAWYVASLLWRSTKPQTRHASQRAAKLAFILVRALHYTGVTHSKIHRECWGKQRLCFGGT